MPKAKCEEEEVEGMTCSVQVKVAPVLARAGLLGKAAMSSTLKQVGEKRQVGYSNIRWPHSSALLRSTCFLTVISL